MVDFEQYRDQLRQRPLLVVLVGESGVGKSTFAKELDLNGQWIISSDAIKAEVSRRGLEVNHSSIHLVGKELYAKDPYWQTSQILQSLEQHGLIVYDGPRKLLEFQRLLAFSSHYFVIEIIGSQRLTRLRGRDNPNMTIEDFERLSRDELLETELNQICQMANVTILNNRTIEELQKKASAFSELLSLKGINEG